MKEIGDTVREQTDSVNDTQAKYNEIADAIKKSNESILKLAAQTEAMEHGKDRVVEILESLASIAEENAASTQEVSASTQEQAAQIREISVEAEKLVSIADELKKEVLKFKL